MEGTLKQKYFYTHPIHQHQPRSNGNFLFYYFKGASFHLSHKSKMLWSHVWYINTHIPPLTR